MENKNRSKYKFIQIEEMQELASELDKLLRDGRDDDVKSRLDNVLLKHKCQHVDYLRSTESLTCDHISRNHKNDWTLLHIAAYENYEKFASFLLKINADPNSKNNKFQTPLHIAAKNIADKTEITKLLLNNEANIEALSKWHPTLHKKLTRTPLIEAIGSENLEVIKLLLKRGANVEAATMRNNLWDENVKPYHAALHCAIAKHYPRDKKKHIEIIRCILNNSQKPNIERKTRWGEGGENEESKKELTPLELVSVYRNKHFDTDNFEHWREIANLLIDNGADTSVLGKVQSVNEKLNEIGVNTKEIKQKVEKSAFEKIVEYTSLVLGLSTGVFAIYEVIFNEKKSKTFCLACAGVTTGLLLIFALCKILPSKQLTDPKLEEQKNIQQLIN
jgi:ankyrin repeat protein